MKFYLEQVDSVFSHVKSSENGITTAEAEKRLAALNVPESNKQQIKQLMNDLMNREV